MHSASALSPSQRGRTPLEDSSAKATPRAIRTGFGEDNILRRDTTACGSLKERARLRIRWRKSPWLPWPAVAKSTRAVLSDKFYIYQSERLREDFDGANGGAVTQNEFLAPGGRTDKRLVEACALCGDGARVRDQPLQI